MRYARLSPGPGFNLLNAAMFYAQRIITFIMIRRIVIRCICKIINLKTGGHAQQVVLTADQQRISRELSSDGISKVGELLSAEQRKEIVEYLSKCPLRDRDAERNNFLIADAPSTLRIADYDLSDVISCPHVLAVANSPFLLDLAAVHIGCKPTISNIGARWSLPEPNGQSVLQGFHRDCEDWRYFNVLIYLSDVDEDSGPHIFVKGTHLETAPIRLSYHTKKSILDQYGADRLVFGIGRAGEAFAVDTSGIHAGAPPTKHSRLMLQFQYSLLPCYAYSYEPSDAPSSTYAPLDPYINRLIVRSASRRRRRIHLG